MFNGHMDTSYSGREPWLRDVPGFQPQAFERDGRLYGLGISNMKGALACYVEAVRALQDAGVRLRGDVLIAAVSGEIEKTQYGDATGARVPRLRGRHALSRLARRRRRHVPARRADGGQGRARALRRALAAHPRARATSSTRRSARGSATQNSILRMHEVLDAVQEWIPTWEDDPANAYRGAKAIVNVGAIEGGFGWRVSRTPHHTDLFLDVRVPPTKEMGVARREVLEWCAVARRALPGLRHRGRGLRHGARRRDRRGARARRRDRRRARAGLRREARARRDALVQRRVRAHALRRSRPSTTARRPG